MPTNNKLTPWKSSSYHFFLLWAVFIFLNGFNCMKTVHGTQPPKVRGVYDQAKIGKMYSLPCIKTSCRHFTRPFLSMYIHVGGFSSLQHKIHRAHRMSVPRNYYFACSTVCLIDLISQSHKFIASILFEYRLHLALDLKSGAKLLHHKWKLRVITWYRYSW